MSLINEIISVFIEMAPYLVFGFLFAGVLHVFVKKDKIISHLGSNTGASVIKASLFGVPLPLCSCSVIPTAISLKKSGASNAAVLSFLLSTPLTGVDSIVATYGFLGPVFGIFRPIAAFFIGIFGGFSALFINTEKKKEQQERSDVEESSCCCNSKKQGEDIKERSIPRIIKNRVFKVLEYAFKTLLDDITMPLIIGIIISGVISWLIPDNFFTDLNLPVGVQMLIMIVVGIPLYICATSSLPIGAALLLKGLSPGVIFVFLVAGPATNSATVTLIVKEFGRKFFILYFSTISILSICFGLLLDWIINHYGLVINTLMAEHDDHGFSLFFISVAILFFILILSSLYRRFFKSKKSVSCCNS